MLCGEGWYVVIAGARKSEGALLYFRREEEEGGIGAPVQLAVAGPCQPDSPSVHIPGLGLPKSKSMNFGWVLVFSFSCIER